MNQPPIEDDDLAPEGLDSGDMVARIVAISPEAAGARLDKTLAEHVDDLSRARIQALMAQGLVSLGGVVLTDASAKTQSGEYQILIPPPAPEKKGK